MSNPNIEAEISFRFLSLDKFQAYSLVREILGSTHEAHSENKSYIACVPLTQQNFEDINDYYVRQRIEIEACDILVSVNANSTSGIVDIPVIVNRMLKYIDCKLTFSFTAT
ncbi:hypothetical protein [Colwellia psychrerythraea]|uniref:Uncharacterized protein n=1 Tax=Colwellia psychrerythraea (strain 34H / ATCC BAA-681) TaxID=167879 RepID=Q481K4_COLP3|nr:hypothetical protein [Colwellia psychrerythraea]AAZ24644.1 hypothetical protein CPS_2550 [Colwellia psychrerythraea 34H]